ncbi:MAG: flagellar protein FlgN [Rhodocyclaceae bacterium]|nr:flagellar protein FlgN [Rhodocyclaceae bacterium]
MSATAFSDILRRELEGMRQLGALLAEEFTALGSGDSEALERAGVRKAELLDRMQKQAAERGAALQAAGVGASREAIEAWLAASGDGLKVWRELLGHTREVQSQQQANHALLEGLMRHNQKALDLLIQLANPQQTYQADGSTSGGFAARSRGSA